MTTTINHVEPHPSPFTFDAVVNEAVGMLDGKSVDAQSGGFRPNERLERLTRHCAADQEFFDELSTRCRIEAVLYAVAKVVHRVA